MCTYVLPLESRASCACEDAWFPRKTLPAALALASKCLAAKSTRDAAIWLGVKTHAIPFSGKCTTHFSLFWWASLGVRAFDPWPSEFALIAPRKRLAQAILLEPSRSTTWEQKLPFLHHAVHRMASILSLTQAKRVNLAKEGRTYDNELAVPEKDQHALTHTHTL